MVKEADMNALRFLLVHSDAQHADRISSLLAGVNHTVLPVPNLTEGAEALLIERFDAALVEATLPMAELSKFTAALRQMEENRGLKRIPVVSVSAESAPDIPSDRENPAWDTCLLEPLDPI